LNHRGRDAKDKALPMSATTRPTEPYDAGFINEPSNDRFLADVQFLPDFGDSEMLF
jgi:hypothetical protein